MFRRLLQRRPRLRCSFLLAAFLLVAIGAVASGPRAEPEELWKKLEPFARPPQEFAGRFGSYRSPLEFADGAFVKTAADWARRRAEILKTWHKRLGPWPPLIERPLMNKREPVKRDQYTEYQIQVQASPRERGSTASSSFPRDLDHFPPSWSRFMNR